ncbi:MAG TPA: aspartate kinase [Lachnospiraceae bacterium]|nr:aspartate kinase [Lachnospiraceae bacterium]
MKKVVKFGGSSLASARQFKKVKAIIDADKTRCYVVPSAPGKRDSKDTKVTDMLYQCYDAASTGQSYKRILDQIKKRYTDIIDGLELNLNLDFEFSKIEENFLNKVGRDYAASRGEYLNGLIMANYLGFTFVDAADVIRFDADGNFLSEETNEEMREHLASLKQAVIPGFYGAKPDGTIHTFSRGGSDITGSIVARAIQADLYENWTDVSGFLVADPRIVDNPAPIETITYTELRELSYMGASVLHEDAIFPVRKEGIPINIRNTNRPQDPGTLIVESTCRKPRYTITGIAGKKGFAAINIEKDMMNSEIGFCRKVLTVFEDNGISIEHMPSGIDTMTVFVHQSEFEETEQKVLAGIHRAVNPDSVNLESDLALIAVVGRGMKSQRGTAGRIFSALAHASINVKMIDQGSSEMNIIIGVSNQDFERAIKSIYDIFVTVQL